MKFASKLSELLTQDDIASMSGLDFMAGILEGRLPAPPICKALNYRLESVAHGSCVFRGTPVFDAMNPIGSIHGGWFGTLLDSCMACAVQTTLPVGALYTTLEYKINIIRPIFPDTGDYRAEGQVDHVGRRTGIAHGKLIGVDDGKTYATGSTTCLIMMKQD